MAYYARLESIPFEKQIPYKRANEDTDDDITIEIHGQQHDEVRHRELGRVQERSDELLERCRHIQWRRSAS